MTSTIRNIQCLQKEIEQALLSDTGAFRQERFGVYAYPYSTKYPYIIPLGVEKKTNRPLCLMCKNKDGIPEDIGQLTPIIDDLGDLYCTHMSYYQVFEKMHALSRSFLENLMYYHDDLLSHAAIRDRVAHLTFAWRELSADQT